ncbi:MAG: glutathione S-transferase [Betaproteobacteria bacterium]|nr:glutathione S-transferase [Betaproteobacteria bacterium]
MKIYEYRGFPNPSRIRIALGEKHAADKVEFITVDVPKGEHKEPAFLAKNPSGVVPVLELDDGTMIAECTAITEYIDHVFAGPSLTGSTPIQRAKIHMMQRRAEAYLLEPVNAYFHHATPGLGPRLETYQNKEWGEKQYERAIDGMRYFDKVLSQNAYVVDDEFSMADITLFAGLLYADFVKLAILTECKALLAWRQKVAQRPSVACC